MAINELKRSTKLNAILSKNIDDIMNRMPYLPRMSNSYTRTQVSSWLTKVAQVLQDVRDLNDSQLETYRLNLYNGLSPSSKVIADEMYVNKHANFNNATTDSDYDKLVALSLIKFITTP